MVAEATGRPDTRLPFQAAGIDRRGAAHTAPRSLSPTVAVGWCWGGGEAGRGTRTGVGGGEGEGGGDWCGEKRSRTEVEWSGAGTIFCAA